jgi:hypothetical protein
MMKMNRKFLVALSINLLFQPPGLVDKSEHQSTNKQRHKRRSK